jgi:hypothetical protein
LLIEAITSATNEPLIVAALNGTLVLKSPFLNASEAFFTNA